MSILEVEKLSKVFRTPSREVHAVNDVSFQVQEGEILAVLGPNGAGKTTMIGCLCSLLEPTEGMVVFRGSPLPEVMDHYRGRIGVVLEGNRNVYWYMSALDNLRYFGRLLFLEEDLIARKSEELLRFFDLWDVRSEPVGTFSRGMQQKVAISVAFLNSPELLFLDEPSIGLDVIAKRQLVEQIRSLSREKRTTVILTSHQLDVVDKLADRILVIEKGKMIQLRPTEELKDIFLSRKLVIETRETLTDEQKTRIGKDLKAKETAFSEEDGLSRICLLLNVSDSAATAKAVKLLLEMGIPVHSVRQEEPTLEDVYVELFGKRGSGPC